MLDNDPENSHWETIGLASSLFRCDLLTFPDRVHEIYNYV